MILKVAVPRFRGPCLTPICASARPARCSANIPTLAEVQPSVRRSLDRLLEGQVIDDANLFSEKLQEWEDYYNYHRPHGRFKRPDRPTNAYDRQQKSRCHRPSSVAHQK